MHISYLNRPDEERYEVHADGTLAGMANYKLASATELMFVHTEIRPEFRGLGLANSLAEYALEDVRGRQMSAVPACEFIAEFIRKHPKYIDLVRPQIRASFLAERA
jgi:uncharacterized protein